MSLPPPRPLKLASLPRVVAELEVVELEVVQLEVVELEVEVAEEAGLAAAGL